MVQSMTGFGSAESGGFRVEVRSLNHRFMEVFVKLPPALGRLDMPIRDGIKARFSRGKFDVFVSVSGVEGIRLALNSAAAAEVHSALKNLKDGLRLGGDIGLEHLLPWKDLFIEEEASREDGRPLEALAEALDGLEKMRRVEGEALAADISSRVEAIDRLKGEIKALGPSVAEASRGKFLEKLRGLLAEGPFDEAAVLQEASSVAEKSDISEELSRVGSHAAQMSKILKTGGTIGRKLDFLLQELHREANTIASKAGDERVLTSVIEMKAEIERAREQAQNIQ
jgi:uncharacterized protein (TIGR00255 family)